MLLASVGSAAAKGRMVYVQLELSDTHLLLAASCWQWLTVAAFTCVGMYEVLHMHAASAAHCKMLVAAVMQPNLC